MCDLHQVPEPYEPGPLIHWVEAGESCTALWRSEAGILPHRRVRVIDDSASADTAYRLACEGTALLWRGDFQNARQMLQAMTRRSERKSRQSVLKQRSPAEAFHLQRMAKMQRSRTLGMLLIPFELDHRIPLSRAPDVRPACEAAYGEAKRSYLVSLRELLGVIGAYEWRRKGVMIPALGGRIHPHYGVFSPVRGEYVALVAEAPLPAMITGSRSSHRVAFDIGTGTGVLAAVLARRNVPCVVATDRDRRAIDCARENITRLGLSGQVEVLLADLFPPGRAALVVCNPPWVPARPGSPLDHAVFDPESRMLREFLGGLAEHLESGGEGWLILSDLAEHLELRSRAELMTWVEDARLRVLGRLDVRPSHRRAADTTDPLYAARAAEVTSLWRLGMRGG